MSDVLVNEVTDLRASNKRLQEEVGVMRKNLGELTEVLKKTRAPQHPNASDVFPQIWARQGEDIMSSRGYSFQKTLGLITGAIAPNDAKHEIDLHNRLHKCVANDPMEGYVYGNTGRPGERAFIAPLSTAYLHQDRVPADFRKEMKSMVYAGVAGADPDEMRWVRRKTLSWLSADRGGDLVAPPEQGELIELLRNKEALVNAGARTVPLPPQGRMKYPRQTAASLTFWIGENSPITSSDIGTGEITLQAKKLCVLIKAPNELIRFASPATEALIRDDMTKSLALGLDLAGLEGSGGDNRPRGVINIQNITKISSQKPGTNGDGLDGRDIYRFPAAVEEANATFEAFIMRPKTLYKYYQLRFDAVAQGDAAGGFLFSLIREAGEGIRPKLAGYDVVTSTQISQVRSKGTSSSLTYIVGGMWSDMLIGMFGAIEFAATTLGDTPFVNDQTWVRGILSADIAVRHDAAFVFMDNLDVVNIA